MTKYKEYADRMILQNQKFFEEFKTVHDKYTSDQEKYQTVYNDVGQKALLIIKEWEDKLCKHSEKAGYSVFTASLAEKFQGQVKKKFPMIDWVGVISKTKKPEFTLKKITLS